MTPERFQRARELFEQAQALPPSERKALLSQPGAGDGELFAFVRDLLRRAERQNAEKGQEAELESGDRLLGVQIGPYRIRGVLGQGGMGTVFEAEHERTRQVVALKLVRPGLATPDLLRRFEFELQVLARLEHPNIARIYHADTADIGGGPQPYFAMELVRGQNLIQYAMKQKLTIRQRLELAAKIADAVQYAHQQGVIHRDLKPGNILVTADGQPKILDFGVARATDSDVQSTTLQTDIGQLIGTLPYMSPEQAGGDPNQIDTRSDVYALGVVIYELLTGRLPYLLERRLIHEVVRIIKEEEPTRLSSLNRTLRGDVETIVGKALEKEKERRYASANALAADIRRYLNDEPIAARPPSATYQLGKFARRNKVLVGGVVATFFALTAGLATSIVLFQRAEEQTDRAKTAEARERGERERAEAALVEVTKSRDETKQVAEFQENMLAQIDPTTAGVRLTEDVNRRYLAALEKQRVPEAERQAQADAFRQEWMRVNATDAALALIDETILTPAVKAIDRFKDQPSVEAQLRQVLAYRYQELGLLDKSMPLQQAALNTRRRLFGNDNPDTLVSISTTGGLLHAQGKYSDAETYTREALDNYRRVFGDNHPETIRCITDMGTLARAGGRYAEAEKYLCEALDRYRRVLGEEHPYTLRAVSNMGGLRRAQDKLTDAETYVREALEKRRRVLGEEHADTLSSINQLADVLHAEGKFAEAEPYFREALDKRRRDLGEEHPDTLSSIYNLGGVLWDLGRFAEAELYYREALEKCRRVLGEDHPNTLRVIGRVGLALKTQGKLADAQPYYQESLAKRRRLLGEEHPDTLRSMNNLALLFASQGKFAEAESYGREALDKRRRALGEEHADTLNSLAIMGFLLSSQGKLAEAESYNREALDKRRRALGEEHPDTLISINNMGVVLATQGKLAEAEPYYREALDKSRRVRGEEHPDTLNAINNLGKLLKDQDRHEETISLLAPAEPAARNAFHGSNKPSLGALLATIGKARASLPYTADRFVAAEANLIEAHAIFTQAPRKQDKNLRESMEGMIDLYTAWNKAEAGVGYDIKAAEWQSRLNEWATSTQPSTRPASQTGVAPPSNDSGRQP